MRRIGNDNKKITNQSFDCSCGLAVPNVSQLPSAMQQFDTKQRFLASAIPEIPDTEEDTATLEKTREQIEEPPQYIVYLLNDDYTTFDFVVKVLVNIFKKSIEQAVKITNDVHHKGKGACGVYPRQIAETKIALVEQSSSSAGFPLKCVMEEA